MAKSKLNEILKLSSQVLHKYSSESLEFSSSKIAKKAGITQSLIFYYYKTKYSFLFGTLDYMKENMPEKWQYVMKRESMSASSGVHKYKEKHNYE